MIMYLNGYGVCPKPETLSMRSAARKQVNVLEMKCLRSFGGVSRLDRVKNEEVCRTAGIEMELASRADQRVLRWFGHVERIDEYRMIRRVLTVDVGGGWMIRHFLIIYVHFIFC